MRTRLILKIGGLLLVAAGMAGSSSPASTEMIGRTTIVLRQVTGTLGPDIRRLNVPDDVAQTELIATAPQSASEILFVDGTTVALGPDTQLVLDELVYDPRPSRAKLALRVVEGAFRFVTGAFSSNAYTISTPTATIGVRGTDFGCVMRAGAPDRGPSTDCQVSSGAISITNRLTNETSIVGTGGRISVGNARPSASADETESGSSDLDLTPQLAALEALDRMIQQARIDAAFSSPRFRNAGSASQARILSPGGSGAAQFPDPAALAIAASLGTVAVIGGPATNPTQNAVSATATSGTAPIGPITSTLALGTLETSSAAVASPSGL